MLQRIRLFHRKEEIQSSGTVHYAHHPVANIRELGNALWGSSSTYFYRRRALPILALPVFWSSISSNPELRLRRQIEVILLPLCTLRTLTLPISHLSSHSNFHGDQRLHRPYSIPEFDSGMHSTIMSFDVAELAS